MIKNKVFKTAVLSFIALLSATGLAACSDGDDNSADRESETGAGIVAIDLDGSTIKCDSPSVQVDETTVTIISGGEYILSGNLSDGMIIVNAGKSDKVHLVFDNVSINNSTNAAVYVRKAGETVITLKDGSSNSLSSGSYTSIDDNDIDGCIFSKSDLVVNGTGSLDISANEGHGIVSKDSLTVSDGTFAIKCAEDAFNGKDSLTVSDGTFTVNAGDDGMHSDGITTINGGKITIEQCCEGIEGSSVSVTGGEIRITSTDDGINAAGDDDAVLHSIDISGGKISIKAAGDGIDSNGSFTVSGGTVYVSGSENGGNGALDYVSTGQITGGTLIAVGNSQMAMNMDSSSTQGSILVTTDKTYGAGTLIKVTDSDGNNLIEYTAESSFNSVVASAEGMEKGGTYTISIDGNDTTVTLEDIIYGSGSAMGPGGMGHGGMRPDGGNKPSGNGMGPDGEMPSMPSDGGMKPEGGNMGPGENNVLPEK